MGEERGKRESLVLLASVTIMSFNYLICEISHKYEATLVRSLNSTNELAHLTCNDYQGIDMKNFPESQTKHFPTQFPQD